MELLKIEEVSKKDYLADIRGRNLLDRIFPFYLKPGPQLNEVYEPELAFYESQILSDEEIIRNGAYFAQVDGMPTRHSLICRGEPVKLAQNYSSRLKSFFQNNIFKTCYATSWPVSL